MTLVDIKLVSISENQSLSRSMFGVLVMIVNAFPCGPEHSEDILPGKPGLIVTWMSMFFVLVVL